MILDWYTLVNQISGWAGEWFGAGSYQTHFPLLAALLLGITGALAPCQILQILPPLRTLANGRLKELKPLFKKEPTEGPYNHLFIVGGLYA